MEYQEYKATYEECGTSIYFVNRSFDSAYDQLKRFMERVEAKGKTVQAYRQNRNVGDRWLPIKV